jgi:hypothetical protein
LTGPDGESRKPGLDTHLGYYSASGKVPASGAALVHDLLVPGRWEVAVDLGARGVHRRTVDVRACETAEVDLVVP